MADINLNDVAEGLRAGKDALEIVKGVLGLLPKNKEAEKAASQLEAAEKGLEASKAQLAKALGYKLCRCTLPPQPMLWKQASQVYACDVCGNQINPKPVIQTRSGASWGRARRGQ